MTVLVRRLLVTSVMLVCPWWTLGERAVAQTPPETSRSDSRSQGDAKAQEVANLIREMHVTGEKALGDVNALDKYFDPDVTIAYFYDFTRGWQAYKDKAQKSQMMSANSSYGKEEAAITHQLGEIHVKVHGDIAWAVYPYNFTAKDKDKPLLVSGFATMVLTHERGKWQISHYQVAGRMRPAASSNGTPVP